MMRSKPGTSMQKTYDDCYLICSTAVYFESKNNEEEALRSWRNALDQIYYHNAYRVPANYRPKSETEKALQQSLRQMELQCKERVDLLEALKRSRDEADGAQNKEGGTANTSAEQVQPKSPEPSSDTPSWLGQGTVPPVDYNDLSRPPPLPQRPQLLSEKSSDTGRSNSLPTPNLMPSLPKPSRTPSPEKRYGLKKTLRPSGKSENRSSSTRLNLTLRNRPPAAATAASQAWGSSSSIPQNAQAGPSNGSTTSLAEANQGAIASLRALPSTPEQARSGDPLHDDVFDRHTRRLRPDVSSSSDAAVSPESTEELQETPPRPPPHRRLQRSQPDTPRIDRQRSPLRLPKLDSEFLAYRKEYPSSPANTKKHVAAAASRRRPVRPSSDESMSLDSVLRHDRVENKSSASNSASHHVQRSTTENSSPSGDEYITSSTDNEMQRPSRALKAKLDPIPADVPDSPQSQISDTSETPEAKAWKKRVNRLMKRLPKGVDKDAAQQIFNEIVIHGDEVHWSDIAGLEVAKSALKETVVYPFLRPDLFMGLREPARGMLLFGPPGTGKTMLARAVATESRSTFFAISASSLTSKYLGESEKLVRALFALAKALAPSIIFVDEIDSLLSSRSGSGEHEATRRIKTEFLIQWSDLQKAAAGREEKDKEKGDASRVLVLAATNLPWAIDEAARRRFVRRQYIPLPEPEVREVQLRTLMSHQKHDLDERDFADLVELTDGFSGSDITALAKDAAMGPLRSLGEKLLEMTMEDIRPIRFEDFEASLMTIRPSVSKQGLKEYEDWARQFGERGG